MVRDIRHAGLNDRLHRQLNQAVQLIYSSYDKAAADAWNGGACDLLVADARDPEGWAAIEEAERSNTTVLAITDEDNVPPHAWVRPNVTAARLTRAVESLLFGEAKKHSGEQPAIVRLVSEATLFGRDVDASLHGRTISLRPSLGRVFARSYSDLRELGPHLTDPGWIFQSGGGRDLSKVSGLAAMRLEAFYLLGLDGCGESLPPIPQDAFYLTTRPDLGDAAQLDYPLRIVEAIRAGGCNGGDVAFRTGRTTEQIGVVYWSLRAANVLRLDREAETEQNGKISRLFGRRRSPAVSQLEAS